MALLVQVNIKTITNIIANVLYQGKRVLFVAEKMAALEVVQKRLENLGLDPFCLELHSNKAKKSKVIEQLQKATELLKKTSPLEYQSEAKRLYDLRIELNSYVESLHKKYPFGFSLFDCFNGYAQLHKTEYCVTLNENLLHELTVEKFIELTEIVEELNNAGTLCKHPNDNPLTEINITSYSQSVKTEAQKLIQNYIELLLNLINLRKIICKSLKINIPIFLKDQDSEIVELTKEVQKISNTPAAIFQTDNIEQKLGKIIEILEHGIKRDEYRSQLLSSFKHEILKYDAQEELSNWKLSLRKWFIPRCLDQNKMLRSLNKFAKSRKTDKENVSFYLDLIIQFKEEQNILDENSGLLSQMLDFLWDGDRCEWSKVIKNCESITKVHHSLITITKDPNDAKEIRNWLASVFADGSQTFKRLNEDTFQSYICTFSKIIETERKLHDLLGIIFVFEETENMDWAAIQIRKASKWLEHLDDLRDWVSWNLASEKAINKGLSSVVDSYKGGFLKNEDVVNSFHKGFYRLLAEHIISLDSNLSTFNGKIFENKINKYKQNNNYFQELTKAELFAKLASSIPSFTLEAVQSSEIGILQRALRSNGRGMTLRKLFDGIPNLLPRLCPCMLMSPISVAQYFPIDQSKFDLIIFDEASQMPTCEAVGAIARGKNMVVVGDPKQMPPTNFFSSIKFDEENYDFEDLESILDDCLALSIPSKHLLWHYRSKHESLIAFSNAQYYDNKLMTFPSPDDLETKVNYVHVPGYYDRGKTRQNKFEATAIVEDIISRLSDPFLSQRSIGVVTFSIAQQNLIEDLLNETLQLRPDLDKIAMESVEPIFIKNLENVQGDERDVILFSVGYGPDKDGRVSLNFGPLNRDGGWRRLNVAVSRARYEMTVYSSLCADQIDITRTTSEGVLGIKAFLEYSEKGKKVLPNINYLKSNKKNSFINVVAEEIRKLGYNVNTEIGCSGYKIDIGVVNSYKPTEYILGILTDGENYRSAKTARDREIVRPDVLKMLGWRIYKLWSPDWWDNPQKSLQEIIVAIDDAINNNRQSLPTLSIENQDELFPSNKHDQFADVKFQGITQHIIENVQLYETYKICDLSVTVSDESSNFNELEKINNQIKNVLSIEAPISSNLLSKRILNAWGISRLGVRLNNFLNIQYQQMNLKNTIQNGSIYYWRDDQDPRITIFLGYH